MKKSLAPAAPPQSYDSLREGIQRLIDHARYQSARSINFLLTATYWEIGRRIVVHDQSGEHRAEYGEQTLMRLSQDLVERVGRGFGLAQLKVMRQFYLAYVDRPIGQSVIGQSSERGRSAFPLSWTHYVLLLRVGSHFARTFYEAECVRAGWTVRQLGRQIATQFYERTALSRDKTAALRAGRLPAPNRRPRPEEELREPYVLEFLNLRDDYSESDLEEALITHMKSFLMELGPDYTFVGRQVPIRVGRERFSVDLLFFHRGLRCLVLADLKLHAFTHADAGQMHLYLNYAREHWIRPRSLAYSGVDSIIAVIRNSTARCCFGSVFG